MPAKQIWEGFMTPGSFWIIPFQFSDLRGKMTLLHNLHPENMLEKDPTGHLVSHSHVRTNHSDQRTQPGLWAHPCGSEVGPLPRPPNWGAVLDWKSSKMGGSEKCLDIQGIGCKCLEVLFKDNRGILELPVSNQQQHRSLRELLNACLEMFIKII